MPYCSLEFLVADWPRHKHTECTPVGSSAPAASAASSSGASSSGTNNKKKGKGKGKKR